MATTGRIRHPSARNASLGPEAVEQHVTDGAAHVTVAAGSAELPVKEATLTPMGYQQITDLAASTALTVPTDSTIAVLHAEGQDIRWRDDGVAPTASVGMVLAAGDTWITASGLAALRFIQAAASAKLNVSYYS